MVPAIYIGMEYKAFLQERFGIKLIDPGKLGLPDFDYFGKDDFVDFGEYLPKPRKALSEIQNLATVISDKTPVNLYNF